ncbi:hypothetical protein N473_25125 [Pseudoalteromonas luteoviolacea CPMOR-1]|uniref:PKD/Chitinase domain-containing protein n=1 Tax=Pseudoalteromonas luteoviolacea CPMOR-1 TaxID=1365248 RepID=A0A167IU96_9GAMM|nr:hypothetical protein [Pseudoalteromonas luteoviolacea]KZN60078.1 hypothetical protein N473_25125 [Pseudoalteromonas luteoviolacea CPMOR-1]
MTFVNSRKCLSFKHTLIATALITFLSACGGGSSSSSSTSTGDKNKMPNVTINSVADVESGAEVRLLGSASDTDGSITSYQWLQKSGVGVTIRDKDQANASFTAPVLDTDVTLEFELIVTDDKGGKATETIYIKIKRAVQVIENKLPNAAISAPDSISSGAEVRLVSSSTDSDGHIVSYQWSQKSGYGVTIRDKDQANASFSAPVLAEDTTLEFELVVTDDKGGKARASFSLAVKAAISPKAREYLTYKRCNVDMASAVHADFQGSEDLTSKASLINWLCSAQGDIGTQLQQDIVNTLSADGGISTVEAWKEAHCSVENKSYRVSRAAHSLIQVASDNAVSNWVQCMQQTSEHSVVCYAKEQNDSLLMHMNIKPEQGQFVVSSIFGNNLTNTDVLPTAFSAGETKLRYQRDSAQSSAYFEVSGVDNQGVEHSCAYSMASLDQVEADECEQVRQQALEQARITEIQYIHYRNFDVVPVFSQGSGGSATPSSISCALYKQE